MLLSEKPELLAQWNYEKNSVAFTNPNLVACGSNKKAWWKCNKGHEWEAAIYSRAINNHGCPYCSGRKAIPGENDLPALFPQIAEQWDEQKNGGSATGISPFSHKKVWWRCSNCHSYQMRIVGKTVHNSLLCPICDGRELIQGLNDLLTVSPELATEWDYEANGKTPNEVFSSTPKKMAWKCSRGHKWLASPNNRVRYKQACPYCSGRLAIKGETDLITLYPAIATEWDYEKNGNIDPSSITGKSSKKFFWKCKCCGNSWYASVANRTRLNRGCPYCTRSIPEKRIAKYLDEKGVSYVIENTFEDRFYKSKRSLLKDDFAIKNSNGDIIGAIEYNGEQHYSPLKHFGGQKRYVESLKKDQIKSDYLKTHGIPQLIIPFSDSDKIEKLIDDFLLNIGYQCKNGKGA